MAVMGDTSSGLQSAPTFPPPPASRLSGVKESRPAMADTPAWCCGPTNPTARETTTMNDSVTRREFIKTGSTGLALGLAASALGVEAQPSERLRCGFIGVGGRGMALLWTVLDLKAADVVAICDITPVNLERAGGMVEQAQGKADRKSVV